MKNFLVGEIRLDKFYGVVLKKEKNYYIFDEEVEISIEELGKYLPKYKFKIAIDTIDYQLQKVSIPKIKDNKTKELLIKNKLSQILEDIEKFKLLFFKTTETDNTEEYNVYLIPLYLVNELLLDEEDFLNLDILTLSIFSISGITKQFLDERNIFSVVVDDFKIVISLIQDGILEYSRTTTIPTYISTEEEFLSFCYENINLTYMYVLQNLRKEVNLILFSGKIYNNVDLVKQVYKFANKPIGFVYPIYTVKNLSTDKFHQHISHIGILFLDLEYDIRPHKLIEKKLFRTFSKYLFLIFFVLSLFLLAFDIIKYVKNLQYKEKIVRKANNLHVKYENIVKQSSFAKGIDYYIKYLNIISKLEENSLLKFLYEIKDIFKIHKFENVTLDKKGNNLIIALNSQIYFPSLVEATLFKSKLEDTLEEILQKNRGVKLNKTILLDINKFTVDIDINIQKEIQDEK